jgi:predicted CXXCH cytochrome family protein
VGSKHDLSATGPGAIRAAGTESPCSFCHLSHDAGKALSARPETSGAQRGYESSTFTARAGAPTGASRACLSCHDGTVAVGATRSGRVMAGAGQPLPAGGRSTLGTDLRGSHPVSFRLSPSARVRAPVPGDAVKLDRQGLVQCTSCHDPHAELGDPEVGRFLVKRSARSELCLSCHDRLAVGGTGSGHATSAAPVPAAAGGSGTRTVADAGCGACHAVHGADPRGQLLRPGRTDDDTCLACHAGTTIRVDLGREVSKPSAHAATERGGHLAGEGPEAGARQRLPEASPGARRHVTCVDCHGAHGTSPDRLQAGAVGGAGGGVRAPVAGSLLATWGIDLDGRRVEPARFEYEVCLKCHGDSANQPRARSTAQGLARRAAEDPNLRRVFSPTAASFHPVAAPGKNPDVPGLVAPLTAASQVYCTDCHASDAGPGAGGAGARGPHGSVYPALLERPYATADGTVEGPAAYALCYKCHDRETLLSDRSGFPLHRVHVVDRRAACSACHDPHGVSSQRGNEQNNAHLVDFDVNVVRADAAGRREYRTAGPRHGSCALACHGSTHDPATAAY